MKLFVWPVLRFSSSSGKVVTKMGSRGTSRVISNIQKPPSDVREYRGLILGNQMKVMLISDPSTDKAAAALSVAAGML